MSTMGERIRQLRKAGGLTQTALAEKLGVTKGTVSTWETNSRRPGFETLMELCDLFDRDAGYVMGTSDEPGNFRMSEEEQNDIVLSAVEEELTEYALKYARLDEFGRRAVQAVIRAEEERCRSAGTMASAKTYSGRIGISRNDPTDKAPQTARAAEL